MGTKKKWVRTGATLVLGIVIFWAAVVVGLVILSVSEPAPPGTIGKMDLFTEIHSMIFVLEVVLPIGGVALVGRLCFRDATGKRLGLDDIVLFVAFVSVVYVALALWIFMDRGHGGSVDMWKHVWWSL